ncbi:unknown similar to AMEV104 [Choristoneura biennis entomopoxvirus]|uniref:Uncharacterized protein n=1 Tax=Choristoneura biennis entomopoxvirus TaxID=10288 RepID=A0A916P108_CBEPV|nr:unknown similar to AMEV104 [Choristoneura biennis entomopoxvirus]CCU55726.1 unknown similar to AMEV104 [Choristoneura biennis entomopoxvirus]
MDEESVFCAIIYNCNNNIESYKDIDLSCNINVPITDNDDIIYNELKSFESNIYKIINYDDNNCDDYDCDLILIPMNIVSSIDMNKIKNFIKEKTEIIIVSKNEEFHNSIKELITEADVTCYTDFKYIIEITNYLLDIKRLKKIDKVKVFNYEHLP